MSNQFTFTQTPTIKKPRSRFDLSAKRLTSGNVGELIPFYLQEVYPGDTMKLNATCVSRLSSSFLKPIMDNLFLDTYFFYVPSRLLYDKFVNVFGENTESAWANTAEYKVPQVPVSPSNPVVSKTVADYLGLPIGALGVPVSVLPFRAFAKVYEDWFRDQNNVQPMHIQTGEFVAGESFNSNDWAPNNYTGKLPKVAKMHDYFTSCLPSPQKGTASSLPLVTTGDVPVITSSIDASTSNLSKNALHFREFDTSGNWLTTQNSGAFGLVGANGGIENARRYGSVPSGNIMGSLVPSNLVAKTSQLDIDPITVNDLRLAFQLQKMLERDARGGTRYCEYLLSHWGVSAGDARLQRSEFLGGRRTPINVQQVAQTSAGTNTNPLADVAAFSLTASRARATKGFVEPGYIIGVCCIRQFHTYQQGIQRFWTRSKRTDFFEPVFSNIGEQPVYKYELFGTSISEGKQVFGYNEAWADLRYNPNMVTGQMRTGVTGSMDLWHLADNYENAPTLSAGFIEETPKYLDRAISVESTEQDQFILDFYVQNIAYRELPTYSIPSLIDHN